MENTHCSPISRYKSKYSVPKKKIIHIIFNKSVTLYSKILVLFMTLTNQLFLLCACDLFLNCHTGATVLKFT